MSGSGFEHLGETICKYCHEGRADADGFCSDICRECGKELNWEKIQEPTKGSTDGYSLERASAFEVGLVYKGKGVRTWWSQTFDGKMPTLDHPEVMKAIEINEQMLGDQPNENRN